MPVAPRYSFIMVEPLARLGEGTLFERFRHLAALGYGGVELQLNHPTGVDLDRLERALADCGLVVPSFLTGEAYAAGLYLCSPDEQVRRAAVDRLVGYLPIVKRFGAIMVVGLMQGLLSDEPDVKAAAARIAGGLRQVAAAAEIAGVDVVIEPVNHLQVGFHNSVDEVLGLVARIGSPAVRPMVDTIHMNIEEASLTEPIRMCGKSLRHVHLCESHGGRLGTGRIDFPAVLATLSDGGYGGWCSVKVYRQLAFADAAKTSIEFLRAIG